MSEQAPTPQPPPLFAVPPYARISLCSCGARMAWVVTPAGRRAPVAVDSPFAVRDERGRVTKAPNHFVDCPEREKFRRPRGKKDED